MNLGFAGKKALVTGASRGIGRAIAEAFAENGAKVWGTCTQIDRWPESPHGIIPLIADFSDKDSLAEFLDSVKELGRIDVCVNNAGINRIKPVETVTPEDYRKVLSVDLQAPYLLSQALIPGMKSNSWGRIINIASIWSVVTKSHRSLYSTAKTGLVGMTRSLAAELAPHGIFVNSVSPGFVMTDLTRESLSRQEVRKITSQIPTGRMAQPEDIAAVVCFLASDLNTYLTGQNIVVDGGFSIT